MNLYYSVINLSSNIVEEEEAEGGRQAVGKKKEKWGGV